MRPPQQMVKDVATYFEKGCGRCDRFDTKECSALQWGEGLQELRSICLAQGLTETSKWGAPCYTVAGRNVAILAAFRKDFRLSFFDAGLLKDPETLLGKSGPNTAYADSFIFRDVSEVGQKAKIISQYLAEAKGYVEQGLKAPKPEHDLDMPEELATALDADPTLAEAFHALTPGRQRGYVINLNGAKQSATRIARIEKFRDKILAGKGPLDR